MRATEATTPVGLFTPVVDGERLTLNVIASRAGEVDCDDGRTYRWTWAPCGLGCHCDAVAEVVA